MPQIAIGRESVRVTDAPICLTALLGAVLLGFSMTLGWASVGIGPGEASLALAEMPAIAVGFGLATATIGLGSLAGLAGSGRAMEVVGLAAAALAVFVFLVIVAFEIGGLLLPGFRLPVSAQRLVLGSGAGPGAWLALATACTVAAVAADSIRRPVAARLAVLRERGPVTLCSLSVFAAGFVALLALHRDPWLVADAFGGELVMDGNAVPVLGYAALAAPWLLACGALTVLLWRTEEGALVAAAAGWVANFCAALTVVLGDVLLDAAVGGARAATAVWVSFAVGLAISAAAAALLLWGDR